MRVAERIGLVLAVAICAPLLAFGQAHPLTINDCVDIALGRSPDLRAAEYDIKAASEIITSTRAGLLPSLSSALTLEGVSGQPTNVFSLLNVVDVENNGVNSQSRTGLLGFGSVSLNYNLFKNGSIFGLNDAPGVEVVKAQKAGSDLDERPPAGADHLHRGVFFSRCRHARRSDTAGHEAGRTVRAAPAQHRAAG